MDTKSNILSVISALLVIAILSVIGSTIYFVLNRDSNQVIAEITTSQPKKEVSYTCQFSDQHLCNFLAVIEHRSPYFPANEPGTAFYIQGNNVEETIIETDGVNIELISKRTGVPTRYVVQIEETIYFKTESDNQWNTKPTSPDIVLAPMVMKDYLEKIQKIESFKKIGEEACVGKTCLIYQAEEGKENILIYFDTANYLLRRFVVKKDDEIIEHVPDYAFSDIEAPV